METENSPKNPEISKNFLKFKQIGNNLWDKTKGFVNSAFNPTVYHFPKTNSEIELERKQDPRFQSMMGGQGPTYPRDQKNYWQEVQPYNYKQILDTVKRCPEAIGIVTALITDIVSDGYRFEAMGSGKKTNKENAEKFCKENFFKQEFKAALMDWLILGDCALYKGEITAPQLKKRFGNTLNMREYKQIIKDEDTLRSIKHIPWSTIRIIMNSDNTAIKGFVQKVSGFHAIKWDNEQIIHGKLMTWDGKAYGFSPVISGLSVLSSLNLIKDINGNFFNNGGTPDWIFRLPKEAPNSLNVQRLEQMLREYTMSTQKHGNMIFTGEMEEPFQMNKFDKDMEFRQHAIYLTGVLALSFNMPLSRIAVVVGTEARSGARSEDVSSEAYWDKISEAQDYWEQLFNTQLFEPHFKVSIRFNRFYKNNEIKESQNRLQILEYGNRIYAGGLIKDNNSEWISNLLHIPVKVRSNKPYIPYGAMGPFGVTPGQPGGGPAPANNAQVMQGPAIQKARQEKRNEQNSKFRPEKVKSKLKEGYPKPVDNPQLIKKEEPKYNEFIYIRQDVVV